jgi:DNA-directed RNA polymerase specialized sigma24 family protein
MSEHGSVTVWLHWLKVGDRDAAATRLWERYFTRLVRLARDRMRGARLAAADEEDVALNAFDSFLRAAEAGRFRQLDDRDDLWQVLMMLTARKAAGTVERERADKRGGGRVGTLSGADGGPAAWEPPAGDPDPSEATALADGLRQMLDALGDDELRQVAVWRMEGEGNAEIAARLGRSVSSVERKMKAIREALAEAGLSPRPPGAADGSPAEPE